MARAMVRTQVRWKICKLSKRLGTTVPYVTHDQVEAMKLADKIVIMRDGHVEQVGSPEEVYARPCNTFVASFIGSPAMNLVPARVTGGRLQAEAFALPMPDRFDTRLQEGQAVEIGIRPSALAPSPDGFPATVEVTEFLGDDALLDLRLGPHELIAQVPAKQRPGADETVRVTCSMDYLHLSDAASGQTPLFRKDPAMPMEIVIPSRQTFAPESYQDAPL
jgi:multiple sugar transport system ATP-binding protein